MPVVEVTFEGDKTGIRHLANKLGDPGPDVKIIGDPVNKNPTSITQVFYVAGDPKKTLDSWLRTFFRAGTHDTQFPQVTIGRTYTDEEFQDCLNRQVVRVDVPVPVPNEEYEGRIAVIQSEKSTLDAQLKEETERNKWAIGEVERLSKIADRVPNLEEKVVETENLRKAVQGLSAAKRKAEADAREAARRLEKVQEEYAHLSETVEEIGSTQINDPVELVLQKVGDASHSLSNASIELEKLINGESIELLLEVGRKALYEVVNGHPDLHANYKSDTEVLKAASITAPFNESEYGKANAEKYNQAKTLLPILANVTMLSEIGVVADVTKALEKEAELKKLKEDYEVKEKEHNESLKISGQLQEILKAQAKAKSFVDYLTSIENKVIPCLITADLKSKTIELSVPKANAYFNRQLGEIVDQAIASPGAVREEEHTVHYKVSVEQDILEAQAKIARGLFDAQQNQAFYKLGFKLKIHIQAKLD
jgi:hypothetical protein